MSEPHIFQNLRRLITVVDELRDVGLEQYIDLPRICVVGTQSAGKSSVLEAIVGVDFLPRGEGVVTRRPLELRLVHCPDGGVADEGMWAIFENDKNKKIFDFRSVKEEIEKLTDDVAGKNKGIVDSPIVLTIFGRSCPDLSLVDLPGITRIPLRGSDQTEDVERLTRDMTIKYAKDPRTIVLAVIPANQDITTSEALQIARSVDPRGVRTVGVVTKIDLMDRGTDASRMLLGEQVPLRLGFVGIKNRSQQEIQNATPISVTLEAEKQFFANHSVYKLLPTQILGIPSLINRLTKILFRHIRHFLPEIKREISNKLRILEGRLMELGTGVPSSLPDRVKFMWTLVTDYCELFRNTIRGKYDRRLNSYFECETDVIGGARIRAIFNELLEEFIQADVSSGMSDYDVDLAIRMHEGDSLPGFPSTDTFEYLLLPHLKKLQGPVIDCLDKVSQTLETLSHKIASRVFGRFPKLADAVLELSQTILSRQREETKIILDNLVASETGYLFTNDSTYLADHGSIAPALTHATVVPGKSTPPDSTLTSNNLPTASPNTTKPSQGSYFASVQHGVSNLWSGDRSQTPKPRYSPAFIEEIRKRLDGYFRIVLRNVRDTVPKTIGNFLVRSVQDKLQFELYNSLSKADEMSNLLGEPPQIITERESIGAQVATLKKASHVLQRDPSIASLTIEGFDELFDSDVASLREETTKRSPPPAKQQPLPVQSQGFFVTAAHPPEQPKPAVSGKSLFGDNKRQSSTMFK